MEYHRKEQYAGTIVYQPRTVLSAEKLAALRRSLMDAGRLQEPENAFIVIDWYFEARDAAGLTGQQYVVLYRDGGDSEEPACAFYRKDVNRRENRAVELLHIPSNQDQPQLTAAWQWLNDASGRQIEVLTGYLDMIMAEDQLWQPFIVGED